MSNQLLSDEEIESTVQAAGGRWTGDRWLFEDADLHPFARSLLAAHTAKLLESVSGEVVGILNDEDGEMQGWDRNDPEPPGEPWIGLVPAASLAAARAEIERLKALMGRQGRQAQASIKGAKDIAESLAAPEARAAQAVAEQDAKSIGEANAILTAELEALKAKRQALSYERDGMLETLEEIKRWTESYPLTVFAELTDEEWQKVGEALMSIGVSLDRVSASNMRHVISGVRKIVDAAMSAQAGEVKL